MKIIQYLKTELNNSSLSNKKQISTRFDRVADHLLKKCLLTIDDHVYLLSEIEFYYYSDIHPDIYVHKHPNQLKNGLWYFHNVGQDLTFGSEGCYGGILIRGIATNDELNDDELLYDNLNNEILTDEKLISDKLTFTDGPVKTFDEIFNKELSLDGVHSFQIRLSEKSVIPEKQKICSFPRVGLYPQGREHDEEYLFKRYRYLSHPWKTKAERHVIYLFLKYLDKNDELTEKLQVDKSMIRDYERAFFEGHKIDRADAENILSGKLKMNVLNKCRLLGWYSKNC
jgi:hypothetical protein